MYFPNQETVYSWQQYLNNILTDLQFLGFSGHAARIYYNVGPFYSAAAAVAAGQNAAFHFNAKMFFWEDFVLILTFN